LTPPPGAEGLSHCDRTSVLVSETSKMHCDLFRLAFSTVRDRFHFSAAASNIAEILRVVQEDRPEVVIVSDHLEDGPLAGIRILPEIRRINPASRILVVMGISDRALIIEAFRSGADGVFCRNSPFDPLWKSLDAIVQGEVWANSAELRYVLDEFQKAPKPLSIDPVVEQRLTRREATSLARPSKAFPIERSGADWAWPNIPLRTICSRSLTNWASRIASSWCSLVCGGNKLLARKPSCT
jgi:DNA-binding NarL/FixJ family response regulator